MGERLGKYFAAVATVLGAVGALVATGDALGGTTAVWTIAAAAVGGLLVSLVGLWISGRHTIASFDRVATEESLRARETAPHTTERVHPPQDEQFIRTQLMPAFADLGLDRTRDFFVGFVDRLDLPAADRQSEAEFIEATYAESQLSKRERIERLVDHFTAPERLSRVSEFAE